MITGEADYFSWSRQSWPLTAKKEAHPGRSLGGPLIMGSGVLVVVLSAVGPLSLDQLHHQEAGNDSQNDSEMIKSALGGLVALAASTGLPISSIGVQTHRAGAGQAAGRRHP
jgi:hypothetical protein